MVQKEQGYSLTESHGTRQTEEVTGNDDCRLVVRAIRL